MSYRELLAKIIKQNSCSREEDQLLIKLRNGDDFKWLLEQKSDDNGWIYNEIAICYKKGICVDIDMKKAIELFTHASKLNNPYAMSNLAFCYENGEDVDKDMKKAVELYTRASELNNPSALNNLAVCYGNGNGIDKDMKKAIELYNRAIVLDDSDAMYNLGICYEEGNGVDKDINKAIELYNRAIDLDDSDAENKLRHMSGDCYDAVRKQWNEIKKLKEENKKITNAFNEVAALKSSNFADIITNHVSKFIYKKIDN